jgi:hypothetical protein
VKCLTHPWHYDILGGSQPRSVASPSLPAGVSPIRRALLEGGALPEQELFEWEKVALNRIRIGTDIAPPVLERKRDDGGSNVGSLRLPSRVTHRFAGMAEIIGDALRCELVVRPGRSAKITPSGGVNASHRNSGEPNRLEGFR